MAKGWRYSSGDWNATCDSCGKKIKASEMRRRWDGLMVCKEDFEERHPQDFIRARQDKISVPWSRPQLPIVYPPLSEELYDTLIFSELVETASTLYRTVGGITPNALDEDTVNGAVLNFSVLNFSSVDPTPPSSNDELITLSETILTTIGYNIEITGSDSITLSETVIEGESEFPLDSLAFSESVAAVLITNKVLNGHLANEVILG